MNKYVLGAGAAAVVVGLALKFGGTEDLTTSTDFCAKSDTGRLVGTKDGGKTFSYLNATPYGDRTGEGASWVVSNNKKGPTCISKDLSVEYSMRAMPKDAKIVQDPELEGYERRTPKPGDKEPVFVPKF